jgi:hypothetical protein
MINNVIAWFFENTSIFAFGVALLPQISVLQ